MSWNYIIEVPAGEDVAAAVMAKHTAHIAKYPGVSQAHAIAATPRVSEAATLAAKAAKGKKGALRVEVSGPDLAYEDATAVAATVTPA